MEIGFVILLLFICVFCRCLIFRKNNIKTIWAILPIVNKYKFGQIVKSKKLGILNAIFSVLTASIFIFCLGYEIWIIKNYSQYAAIPTDGVSSTKIEVLVPQDVANIAIWSKYALIIIVTAYLILWAMMMWRFTIQQDRNPWWILCWTLVPVVAYIAFAISNYVVIDGKKYNLVKEEVKDFKPKYKGRHKK